jgi:hypothetical protein
MLTNPAAGLFEWSMTHSAPAAKSERHFSCDTMAAAGLFEWSMKHSDGTQATQQPSPEELAWCPIPLQ